MKKGIENWERNIPKGENIKHYEAAADTHELLHGVSLSDVLAGYDHGVLREWILEQEERMLTQAVPHKENIPLNFNDE